MKILLLIGINYIGTSAQLSGCVKDIEIMKNFILSFPSWSQKAIIYQLTDDKRDLSAVPPQNDDPKTVEEFGTRPNRKTVLLYLEKIVNLIKESKDPHNEIWVHYSGHGYNIPEENENRDEKDGRDECLYLLDNTSLVDDEFAIFLSRLPENTTFMGIFDCCQSGTFGDLKYRLRSTLGETDTWIVENRNMNIKADCNIFSACQDYQYAADGNPSGQQGGLLTYAMSVALKEKKRDIHSILVRMQEIMRWNPSQKPQYSTSHRKPTRTTIFDQLMDLNSLKALVINDIEVEEQQKTIQEINETKSLYITLNLSRPSLPKRIKIIVNL
jgi:hypothetical protein